MILLCYDNNIMEYLTERMLLLFFTLNLDIFILLILRHQKLNNYDKNFCYIILFLHVIFIYSLYTINIRIICLIHFLLYVCLIMGVFVENKYLLMSFFYCLFINRFLLIIFNSCIMNNITKQKTRFSKLVPILSLLLMAYYPYKIGLISR